MHSSSALWLPLAKFGSIKTDRLPALICDNYPYYFSLSLSLFFSTWEGRDSIIELRVWLGKKLLLDVSLEACFD
jgi:hypothetical protein